MRRRGGIVIGRPTLHNATLQWDAVGGADSYQVEIGTTQGATNVVVTNVGSSTSYNRSLTVGTYYARVKAVTGGTPGSPSNEILIQVF